MEFGDYSYGADVKVLQWSKNVKVKTGKFCSFAANIRFIIDGNHRYDCFTTYPLWRLGWNEFTPNNWGKFTPIIGNDVWVGNDATIYSGVELGDGCIVSGQSVVTKSVPPYAIVAGNPARIVKYRFSADIIEKLLKLKWWDLPIEKIRELSPFFNSGDMEGFISKLEEK
jgi:virginiamycin A acetyltransferase